MNPPGNGVIAISPDAPAPLEVTFSQPVASVAIWGPSSVHCEDDAGAVTVLDATGSGVTTPLVVDRSLCGDHARESDIGGYPERTWTHTIAFATWTTLETRGPIHGLVISPPASLQAHWEQCAISYLWEYADYYEVVLVESRRHCGTHDAHLEYMIAFRELPAGQAELSIVRAEGPNAGSFTTLAGENSLLLEAEVVPGDLSGQVAWDVRDAADDQVASVPPQNAPAGTPVRVQVPAQDPSRWESVPHPGSLSEKSLAFEVRASVDVTGAAVQSTPRTVRQDEIDTIREEYIELGVPQGVPARGKFAPGPGNRGDYSVAVVNHEFGSLLNLLRIQWSPWAITLNGIYRNPVHNAYHVKKGQGSGTVSASWHQYGCAADLQTYPVLGAFPGTDDLKAAQGYWDALTDEALALGFEVEQRDYDPTKPNRPFSGVGHVHLELDCPL